jgi:predicted TPR repeat methyltransferase
MGRDQVARWLEEGARRHRAGDLDAAEALYRRVLARRPEEPNALNLLGVIARARGAIAEAVTLSGRALALRPGSPVFLAAHGAALAEAGRVAEAIPLLAEAVRLRPEDSVSLRNLGQALLAAGRVEEALPPLRRAALLDPAAPEAALALAHALREAGATLEAVRAAGEALRLAAGGPLEAEARFLLAALGAAPPPDRAPASYVRDLFDRYAGRFDDDLTGRLGYETPQAIAALLRRVGVPAAGGLAVLDLGCGTGLSGVALKPFAARLEGVDLSPRMLEEARRRGLYDALHEADLLAFLPRRPAAWDVVAAADVLNYLGDLAPALSAIAAALRPGGHAAFSVEAGETPGFSLGEGLRYRHAPGDVARQLEAAGLRLLAQEETVLRREKGRPVAGVLFAAARPV